MASLNDRTLFNTSSGLDLCEKTLSLPCSFNKNRKSSVSFVINICVSSISKFPDIVNLWKLGTIGITPVKVVSHEEQFVLDVCSTVKESNG